MTTYYARATYVGANDEGWLKVKLESGATARVRYLGHCAPEIRGPRFDHIERARIDTLLRRERHLAGKIAQWDYSRGAKPEFMLAEQSALNWALDELKKSRP